MRSRAALWDISCPTKASCLSASHSSIALVPLTLVAALRPNYRIAPLTAVIVLLTSGAQQLGPLGSAFYRILEITLGSFVGLGVSLVLLPARAHGLVISAAARALGLLADLLGDWLAVLAGGGDRTRITQLQDDIRAGMARLEIVAGEAHQERRTYLTHEFDPDPLVRTVFRLRNDVVMIGRAAAEPLPERIVDASARVARTGLPVRTTLFTRVRRRAARAQRIHPPLIQSSKRSQSSSRLSRSYDARVPLQALPAEGVGRLFALGFSLEQLRHNFEDFRNRVIECARADSGA